MWPYILSGFTIGLAGSLHCLGMCGPLALAIPSKKVGIKHVLLYSMQYNLGRSITYAFLGLMFGWLGNGFFIAGYQQSISISSGLIVLIIWILNYTNWLDFKIFNSVTNKIQRALNKLISGPFRNTSAIAIGLLNGFLPCGLVYVAIGASLASGRPWLACLMMFCFGLGTIPLMISFMISGKKINISLRNKLTKVVPAFVLFISILLIMRGLNLGIPFISPELNVAGTTPKMEHCK